MKKKAVMVVGTQVVNIIVVDSENPPPSFDGFEVHVIPDGYAIPKGGTWPGGLLPIPPVEGDFDDHLDPQVGAPNV